jgi:BirA family biotin operon repressor/biotin-[acetyl-CoA-carboxylase] ligase
MQSDQLNTKNLERLLGQRPFRFFKKIGSTNDVAHHWALEVPDLPSGALVVANEQVAGRGRLGREWQTPPDQALALSFVLRPQLANEHLQQITMLGGVMVAETLSEYSRDEVSIKWPNDVQINRFKACGILSEVVWSGQTIEAVIMGIGINIRVDFSGTPLKGQATSLEHHTTTPIKRLELIGRLIHHFEEWYTQLGSSRLVEHWRNRLNTLGQTVSIHTQRGVIDGLAKDVDASGALLVTDNAGQTHRILVGDVKPRPNGA